MDKIYINIPRGEDIIEDKTMKNSLFFKNLQEGTVEEYATVESHFKNDFMSLLLRKNKLIYILEEIIETAYKLAEDYTKENEEEVNVELVLNELVEGMYFFELGE